MRTMLVSISFMVYTKGSMRRSTVIEDMRAHALVLEPAPLRTILHGSVKLLDSNYEGYALSFNPKNGGNKEDTKGFICSGQDET